MLFEKDSRRRKSYKKKKALYLHLPDRMVLRPPWNTQAPMNWILLYVYSNKQQIFLNARKQLTYTPHIVIFVLKLIQQETLLFYLALRTKKQMFLIDLESWNNFSISHLMGV